MCVLVYSGSAVGGDSLQGSEDTTTTIGITAATAAVDSSHHHLPAGWTSSYDANSGHYYYINTVTNESQWEIPEHPVAFPTSSGEDVIVAADEPLVDKDDVDVDGDGDVPKSLAAVVPVAVEVAVAVIEDKGTSIDLAVEQPANETVQTDQDSVNHEAKHEVSDVADTLTDTVVASPSPSIRELRAKFIADKVKEKQVAPDVGASPSAAES